MGNTIAKVVCVLVITINVIAVWNLTETPAPAKTVAQQVSYADIINAGE